MLTLEETLKSQADLGRLCADRPLRTSEIFGGNAFYGNDAVLKRYAGIPQTHRLKVVVPHGVYLLEDYVWELEVATPLPAVMCYPPYRELAYARHTTKKVILSAAPFAYVVEMLRNQPRPEREGTIFFPVHSTHFETVHADFDRLAERLVQLDDEYQPVTVCMYWRDVDLGRHVPFQERGLRLVSAGHMFGNPDFLYRLYHLCSMHRYAAGNGFGGHLFFAVKAGCAYFHVDEPWCDYEMDGGLSPDALRKAESGLKFESELKALFSEPRSVMTRDQLDAVDYYLGAAYLKSPRGLRDDLLYAERLDKFGVLVGRRGTRRLAVPTYCRRRYQAAVSRLPRPLKRLMKHAWLRLRGFGSPSGR